MKRKILMLLNRIYFKRRTNQLTLRKNVMIFKSCKLSGHNAFGANTIVSNSTIEEYTYFGTNCVLNNLKIGKYCSIGSDVKIGLSSHPTKKFVSTSPYFYLPKINDHKTFVNEQKYNPFESIIIGNDVFVGSNVLINDGVTIGNGAVIAAGAVVVKNVPDYAVVGGVPAKIIQFRFNESQRERLLSLKWWDKGSDWIESNSHKFNDINQFLNN